jgi:hypothetical protein
LTGGRRCQRCWGRTGAPTRYRAATSSGTPTGGHWARAEAKAVVDRWNEQLAAGRDMLWSPTIRATLIADMPWLDVHCPGCGTNRAIDVFPAIGPSIPHPPTHAGPVPKALVFRGAFFCQPRQHFGWAEHCSELPVAETVTSHAYSANWEAFVFWHLVWQLKGWFIHPRPCNRYQALMGPLEKPQ